MSSPPTPFDRQTSFAQYSSENPGEAHDGTDLDAEFNEVKVVLDETQARLAEIQDEDGSLARGSVGRAQLDSSITIGFEAPTAWATATSYEADISTVFKDAKFYTCIVSHTSGTFSADLYALKWLEVADLSVAAALEDGAVTEAKLEDGAVTAAKVGPLAVTAAKIATSAVTTAKIADLNVTTAKIAANAVTHEEVDSSVWSTGDIKLTLKATADAGWRMFDDGTIGDGSSGATYANAVAEDLFTLLFNNIVDANAPILTSAGAGTTRSAQTNAATAWAAHCRMSLPKVLGRALAVAGSGSGLTARALGVVAGAETVTLDTTMIPAHAHAAYIRDPQHTHSTDATKHSGPVQVGMDNPGIANSSAASVTAASTGVRVNSASGGTGTDDLTANAGGGLAHANVQPTSFLNAMVKL